MDDFFNDLLTYDNSMLETAIGGMETMTEGGESAEAYKLVVAVCKDIIARRGGGAAAMDEDKEEAQEEDEEESKEEEQEERDKPDDDMQTESWEDAEAAGRGEGANALAAAAEAEEADMDTSRGAGWWRRRSRRLSKPAEWRRVHSRTSRTCWRRMMRGGSR